MRVLFSCAVAIILCVSSGCVVVNPKGDVHMSPWPESWSLHKHHASNEAPYASSLEKVVKQQDKVVKRLQKQDWKALVDETTDWTEQVRELSGYANTTSDPGRFRSYCDQLLTHTQEIRDAGLHQDPVACNTALRACDPVLDHLSRDFPTSVVTVGTAASPAPSPAGSPPGASPRHQVQVQVQAP